MHPDPPTATAPNPYDLIPYESQPITFTGPEHMAVSALLQGGPRPPVERFRYLEIGCADGGNLLPLAFHHPESFFVGVDSSAAEVEAARPFVDRCIELHAEDACNMDVAAKAKLWTTDLADRVLDRCLQLHGGYGYMWEFPIARAWADARVHRIYAGTNEVMKYIIARNL